MFSNGSKEKIDVSILVPAKNEESRIESFLLELIAFIKDFKDKNGTTFEVILAVDGSTDETLVIAKRFMQTYDVIHVFHCKHRIGKGGALKAAFNESRGDVVVFMDGDGGYKPSEIPLFLKTLETSNIAIGIRSPEKIMRIPPIFRRIAGQVFNILFNFIFRSSIPDTQAGMKAFKRDALQTLLPIVQTNGFVMDAEIIAWAQCNNLDLGKVPISYSYMERSNVNVVRDGFIMFFSLLRIRKEIFSRRHRDLSLSNKFPVATIPYTSVSSSKDVKGYNLKS